MRRPERGIVASLCVAAVAWSACGGTAVQRAGGPFAGDAANATYRVEGQEVRLANGRSTSGSGDAIVETQLTGGRLEGDLDGDGVTDLVVVLAREEAGAGASFHLAALVAQGAGAKVAPSVPLGERLVVKNLAFDGPDITLRLVVPDPENADPRPSKIVERRFRYEGGALVALDPG
jgi:hypothetical protein